MASQFTDPQMGGGHLPSDTQETGAAAGKPQLVIVDEALSSAIRSALKQIEDPGRSHGEVVGCPQLDIRVRYRSPCRRPGSR